MTRGVLLFNKGENHKARVMVCLDSLRQWWKGPVALVVEGGTCPVLESLMSRYSVSKIVKPPEDVHVLICKLEAMRLSPFDSTLYMDTDTSVEGPIDEAFLAEGENDVFKAALFPNLRMEKYRRRVSTECKGLLTEDEAKAALGYPCYVNTGVFAFNKINDKMFDAWSAMARAILQRGNPLPDETSFNVLFACRNLVKPLPLKFHVLCGHGKAGPDTVIVHYFARRHARFKALSDLWVDKFIKLLPECPCGTSLMIRTLDWKARTNMMPNIPVGRLVTVVSACDPKYLPKLLENMRSWKALKKMDSFPMVVFVNGVPMDSPDLDFLRLPNIRIVEWSFPLAGDHREEMLSAFVFGAAREVRTPYWLKLDADSFAINDRPLVTSDMFDHDMVSHKWGYSWVDHIEALDKWAASHPDERLRKAPPVLPRGKVDGRRFWHTDCRRPISFYQLSATDFTRECAALFGSRLPVPSQDTSMWYVARQLGKKISLRNIKRDYGFTQGR